MRCLDFILCGKGGLLGYGTVSAGSLDACNISLSSPATAYSTAVVPTDPTRGYFFATFLSKKRVPGGRVLSVWSVFCMWSGRLEVGLERSHRFIENRSVMAWYTAAVTRR